MIPFRDENTTVRTPVVTIGLIGLCLAVWVLVQGMGIEGPLVASVCTLGLVPGELLGTVAPGTSVPLTDDLLCVVEAGPAPSRLLTHMFLHGSWMHLIGNLWFLWLFGNNVEDSMTRPRFAVFYLLCGLAAAALQLAADPTSAVPMVGASGAISGVMGAYLVLFPRVRVHTLVPIFFFVQVIALPAWFMLIYWMVLQLLGGLSSFASEAEGGVAFWAHVGGFLAGVVLVRLFVAKDHLRAHQSRQWLPPGPRRSVRW